MQFEVHAQRRERFFVFRFAERRLEELVQRVVVLQRARERVEHPKRQKIVRVVDAFILELR